MEQREIKFRAWDKDGKVMHPGFTIQQIGQIMAQHEPAGIHAIAYKFCFNELVFLQYTGLKDKNGKEIYEGDRLSYYFLKVNASTILENGGQITVESIFQYDVMDAIKRADYIEIIGNIYENPELLNQ